MVQQYLDKVSPCCRGILAKLACFYEFFGAASKTAQHADWMEKKKKSQLATGHAEHH